MADEAGASGRDEKESLESERLRLEKTRFRFDLAKWALAAVAAVTSFVVVDRGKLELEKQRSYSDSQRQVLEAYLKATESEQPAVWKRKLHIVEKLTDDERVRSWAKEEAAYIDKIAEKDAIYHETLRVASQIISRDKLNDPLRKLDRERFEQLYWADLPFAHEPPEVAQAMKDFKAQLADAEKEPQNDDKWRSMDGQLLGLSKTLSESLRRD